MQWIATSDGFEATDDVYNAYGREQSIDEFLDRALGTIAKEYDYKDCPAIIFDLWSMSRLLVFDSPSGLELNRAERVYTQLTSALFTSYCEGYMDAINTIHGDESFEYQLAEMTVENLTPVLHKFSVNRA